ncbi:coproporphyrinogen III oxidase family protein [Campylobacter iguaniorum]|nr:coproporphyrinogen III oxidase family protein [Campylobacter iguaniorum]
MDKIQNLAVKYASFTMQKSLRQNLQIDILHKDFTKQPNLDKSYMLYAHIPFCHTFCPYCSFHKYAYNEEKAKAYFENLRAEMIDKKNLGYNFTSMYVGGGTTLINENELLKTLELAKKLFDIKEISCETDPNHINPNELSKFKGLIDRISVGVQSFDDEILKKVARYDKFGSKDVLIDKLSKAIGILPVTSLDLIFNFPFQTKDGLINDISIAKALSPDQITFYPLMKSNITKDKIASSLGISQKDNEAQFYEIIRAEFKDYHSNNSWSFSKTKSNLQDEYVGSNHEYLGVGSGAFSFMDGELYVNAFDLDEYGSRIINHRSATIAKCKFEQKQRLKYLFLTELFDGQICINEFNQKNQANLTQSLFLELTMLKLTKAIIIKDGKITLSKFGRYLFVVLMKEFYIGMDMVRAVFRDGKKLKSGTKLKVMEGLE